MVVGTRRRIKGGGRRRVEMRNISSNGWGKENGVEKIKEGQSYISVDAANENIAKCLGKCRNCTNSEDNEHY